MHIFLFDFQSHFQSYSYLKLCHIFKSSGFYFSAMKTYLTTFLIHQLRVNWQRAFSFYTEIFRKYLISSHHTLKQKRFSRFVASILTTSLLFNHRRLTMLTANKNTWFPPKYSNFSHCTRCCCIKSHVLNKQKPIFFQLFNDSSAFELVNIF